MKPDGSVKNTATYDALSARWIKVIVLRFVSLALLILAIPATNGHRLVYIKQAISPTANAKPVQYCDFSDFHPIRISEFSNRCIKFVKPTYPVESARLRHSGWVFVRILVNDRGDVVRACVVQAPDEEIGLASEAAALKCKFKRRFGAESGGAGGYIQDVIPFNFVLNPPEDRTSGLLVK